MRKSTNFFQVLIIRKWPLVKCLADYSTVQINDLLENIKIAVAIWPVAGRGVRTLNDRQSKLFSCNKKD